MRRNAKKAIGCLLLLVFVISARFTHVHIKTAGHIKKAATPWIYKERSLKTSEILSLMTSPRIHELKNETGIFFTHVPRCGNTAEKVFSQLSKRNGFAYLLTPHQSDWDMSVDRRARFVKEYWEIQKPFLFDQSLYFVNFERFRRPQPGYISIMRKPLDHFLSIYYKTHRKLDKTQFPGNVSFLQCLLRHVDHCSVHKYYQQSISFFCGQDKVCKGTDFETIILKAKLNILKFYNVVGIYEDMQTSYKVLEKVLPQFFGGATQIYSSRYAREEAKPLPFPGSARDIDLLKNRLKQANEFYNFLRTHLYRQAAKLE